MSRFVAAATALLAIATTAAGCTAFGCGVADDYDKGTDGQWVVTRLINSFYGCPVTDDFEQMVITIDGDQVTVDSPGMTLESARVYQIDDRQLVDVTVREGWYATIDGGFPVTVSMTYSFELVPATARLEGTAASTFFIDGSTEMGTCDYSGTASAGRVSQ